MTEATLSLGVRQIEGSACILDIEGDITAFSEEALMDAYTEGAEPGVKAVILNFTGLEYMNSGGIGLLVTLLVRANRQRQRLLACGLNDHYRQIFELTRLDEAVAIYANEVEALAAVSG